MANIPQTYTISDFVEWSEKKQLILSPDFQRGSVWTPAAKVFLIDTILNDLPIPQVYFRSKIDPTSQKTVREVVDGQQRLRSILEFASDKLRLTGKAPRHKGKIYSTLDIEDKERFLSYKVPVVQLLNASDADVLEVFARLNSYSVKVTPAELRHAEYSEPVKWAIYESAMQWSKLWNEYKIVGVRDSVRLKNTSVMAEMYMIVDVGFGDGGEPSINKYYKSNKAKNEEKFERLRQLVDQTVEEIVNHTSGDFKETTFYDAPNFLALFSTIAYLEGRSPDSKVTEGIEKFRGSGVNWDYAQTLLAKIAQEFDSEETDESQFSSFVAATKSTTHRVASRRIRIQTLVKNLSANGVT